MASSERWGIPPFKPCGKCGAQPEVTAGAAGYVFARCTNHLWCGMQTWGPASSGIEALTMWNSMEHRDRTGTARAQRGEK